MKIAGRFKSYFLHGLAVLLPTILTIWLFIWGYRFIKDNISVHINRGLVRLMAWAGGDRWDVSEEQIKGYLLVTKPQLNGSEEELAIHAKRPDIRRRTVIRELEKTWVDGPGAIGGFILAVVGVCVLGALLASVVGRSLWRIIENLIMNTPLVRRVYPYVKQITNFVLAQDPKEKLSFSKVVAVEYPRKGIWSLGFVTGSGMSRVAERVAEEFVTVLIPTAPAPFTGFIIMVPKKDVIDLDITIEQAFRFVVSGGVIGADVSGVYAGGLPMVGAGVQQ
jgi:uncharacterized membrane protein